MRCRRVISTLWPLAHVTHKRLVSTGSEGSKEPATGATATATEVSVPSSSPKPLEPRASAESAADAATSESSADKTPADVPVKVSTPAGSAAEDDLTVPEPEPLRWVQEAYQDPDKMPIVDERGEYIVSKGNWPTGEVAYSTPPPVDDKLAPRFGYNVVSVRKHVSWWKYNQKYPSFSLGYVNIQVIFILGLAWLCAFLTEEYRRATDEMKTPGAMVGEHRGRGPETSKTQKIAFTSSEMGNLVNRAQENWMDGKAEASYIGSKEYQMRKIQRPKEFSVDDFRKR